jgi:hypothetical protein
MNIETAKIVENLLYELKIAEQRLKQLQENIENDNFTIHGTNTIYFSGKTERKTICSLIENYYKEKIEQINNEIIEL